MKNLFIAVLLCGCAWGQDKTINKNGDWRAKVEVVEKKTVDVRALPPKSPCPILCPKPQGCNESDMKAILAACSIATCPDPDRILIGPDGHGKYWCHLPQQ